MKSVRKESFDNFHKLLWGELWSIRIKSAEQDLRLYIDTQTWDYIAKKVSGSVCELIDAKTYNT